ncbi:MAG: endolytic transglycosylase MltG [Defluviitaleaceae bacterium]|nr:endolytic transglycosylase MltG [Defluviitaleaceae bacterium]
MLKRDKNSMIFGIGLGVCAAVAVLFIVYIVQRQNYFNEINRLNDRVLELEAAMMADNVNYTGNSPQTTTPAPAQTTEPETTPQTTEYETTPQTEPETQPETTPYQEYTTPVYSPPVGAGFARVHIPANIGASQIAQILYEAGVVTNLNTFLNHLIANGLTFSLMAGDFTLPLNASFATIVDAIWAGGN